MLTVSGLPDSGALARPVGFRATCDRVAMDSRALWKPASWALRGWVLKRGHGGPRIRTRVQEVMQGLDGQVVGHHRVPLEHRVGVALQVEVA